MPEESTVEKIFAGEFTRAMDAKHRVTTPSEWRLTARDAFYLVPSIDEEYLAGMLPKVFLEKKDELRAQVPAREWPEARRAVFGAARLLTPDAQGRILVPEDFCKTAGLTTNAFFIGVTDSFEIWDPAKRTDPATKPKLSADTKEIVKSLGL